MRIAALYDIHGNLPALEAVLGEVRQAGVDRIVIGGDVCLGPMPRETLSRLRALEVPVDFLSGNCDRDVLDAMRGLDVSRVPEAVREAVRWTARQLGPDDERAIAGWPATRSLDVPGLGPVLFCHATPRDDNEILTRLTPDDGWRSALGAPDARLVVCGHTHMAFDRMVDGVRVVNAGSVGMPFGAAGADWLLIDPVVRLRHTPYDLADAAERIRRTDYPQAQEFAARFVLRPPTEREMLDVFARAEGGRRRARGPSPRR